jgi:hypothetical protein
MSTGDCHRHSIQCRPEPIRERFALRGKIAVMTATHHSNHGLINLDIGCLNRISHRTIRQLTGQAGVPTFKSP